MSKKKAILSAKIDYLIDYAKREYSKPRGLHLNSADWKGFITVGTPQYYSFLINGTMKFYTKSKISGERYDQILKLVDFKKLEAPLLLLFLTKQSDDIIIDFISMLFSHGEAKLFCNDESFQYWGMHYNLTQIHSAYGPGEGRPPNKRDPNRQNLVCKHLWLVLDQYSKSVKVFAKGLLPYYKRMFGLTSPTGIDRLQKSIGQEGFRKIIEQAIVDLNKLKSAELTNRFKQLTNGKLNEIMKPIEQMDNEQEYETIDKSKPEELKKEVPTLTPKVKETPKPETEIETNEKENTAEITPNDMDKMLPEEKTEKPEELL